MAASDEQTLRETPLTGLAERLGARMVPFAGYSMPLAFKSGILEESRWCRAHASLFDVSHMGPAFAELTRPSGDPRRDHAAIAALIEPLVCGDLARLKPGQLRYSLMMNAGGGIDDDLILGRPPAEADQGRIYLVANAGAKAADFRAIEAALGGEGRLGRADAGALIALQGPEAAAVIAEVIPGAADLAFMEFAAFALGEATAWVSRSGYTGEDGFELLVGAEEARRLTEQLLADDRVRPAGLGARDALRLEAGLPLHGHDIDATTSPIEADLGFAVSRRRLEAQDFPGWARVAQERADGPQKARVGLSILEGAPAREGAPILAGGEAVGAVSSGGFSPNLRMPVAMGYVRPALAAAGTELAVEVRGRAQPARVAPLPFVPHRYRRRAA